MPSNGRFLGRLGTYDVGDQVGDEVAQIETPVESVAEGGQVVLGVLAVLQAMQSLPSANLWSK